MPVNEFAARRDCFSNGFGRLRIDAALISGGANLRYLSGFTGSNGMLLVLPGEAILFTDPRYQIQAAQETTCRVHVATGPLLAEVAAAIRRLGLRGIGYDPAHTTCEAFEALHSRLPARCPLQSIAGRVEQLRRVKSEEEIALMRSAAATNSRAFEQATAKVRPGVREMDLAAELEYRMRRLGAEKAAFETIVAGGARSALPHANPTAARLEAGDLVVVDMGAQQAGYASDMTRMLFLGSPGAKVKRLYRAVREAQSAALAAVRAGVTTAHVDGVARRVLRGFGLEKAFVHSTGHGLGLEIHEVPRVGKRDRTRLEAGMAITIEPGAYLEGFGGVRIEDTVVVTARGCEILTPTGKDLRIV